VNDVKIQWFDVPDESVDNYDVHNKSFAVGGAGNYIYNDAIIRFRYNQTSLFLQEYQEVDDYNLMTTAFNICEAQQKKHTIAPAVLWKTKEDKFQLYAGFEIPVTFHGEYTFTVTNSIYELGTKTIIEKTQTKHTIPKGYTCGIGGIFGFTVFLYKNFSIGGEFSPSLLYSKVGGKTHGTFYNIVPEPQFSVELGTKDEMRGITFVEQRFSIGIGVWF
jgi:hypothetical protein